MKIKHFLVSLFSFTVDAIRPLLGPPGACIYPICCQNYARLMLMEKPLYIAIPMICLRVLSCNPITALYFKLRKRWKY